jgi:phosphopantetheine--protein transferase-like protein
MEKQETLRETVARFLQAEPAALTPDFPLTGPRMEGSVARYALDAAIRRAVGVKCRAVYTAKTYGALEAAVLGKEGAPDEEDGTSSAAASAGVPATTTEAGDGNAVSCGVDMELVDNLPEADDYWSHEFYQAHFTKAEIAYCLTKEHPRMHFAARWCAKEALKKCDALFLRLDMNRIEVSQNDDGSVALQYRRDDGVTELPHALSITHTPNAAVAAVVHVSDAVFREAVKVMATALRQDPDALPFQAPSGGLSGKLALLVAVAALVLAMIALVAEL